MREHESVQIDTAAPAEKQTHAAATVGNGAMQGCHAPGTCRPFEHFTERMAGNGVAGVGGDFGLDMGRFGPWEQKQSCSPPDDQQNSLRMPSH